MEEQKNKDKNVKMDVVKNDSTKNPPKYTYEQLTEIASNLFNENRYLKKQLVAVNRLEYLFRVLEIANKSGVYSFSEDFVIKCYKEVEDAMAVPEDAEDNKEE